MALHRQITKTAKTVLGRAGALTAAAITLSLAGVTSTALTTAAAQAATTPSIMYGTLDTQTSTAAAEDKAGVTMAMLELNWSSFEPSNGTVSASYVATVKAELAAYQSAGMKVTLGLGMHDTPSWVFSLANSKYVDQKGSTSGEADFVFSQAVRNAAATYLNLVNQNLPLTSFWAIRLTSGGDAEMLYPGGGTYWAFNNAALTGNGLPSGMTPNPFPKWKPGQTGLTQAQVDQWVNWYIGGLANVTTWQMTTLSKLGFTGYYETVTPGSGTRPDGLAQTEKNNLSNDGTTGVGAVWDRYYGMLYAKSNVIAYISSVADLSGGDDLCAAGDDTTPLTSPVMDSWSATRWISRIAVADQLLIGGENPGYGIPASLNAHYTDTSSAGEMADALRQARTCHLAAYYWAHDVHLWDGTLPFSLYQTMIVNNR
jgi:hypothetical protein